MYFGIQGCSEFKQYELDNYGIVVLFWFLDLYEKAYEPWDSMSEILTAEFSPFKEKFINIINKSIEPSAFKSNLYKWIYEDKQIGYIMFCVDEISISYSELKKLVGVE
jgi:hypothetical protein